jgi:chromosome segregation ATPase
MRTWTAGILVMATLYGCNSDAKLQAKRDRDRTEMELEQTQNERDADKAEIDQLKAQIDASSKDSQQAKSDLDSANTKLEKANDDLAAARTSQTNADQAAAQLKAAQANLQAAQAENDDAKKSVSEKETVIKTLETKLVDLNAKYDAGNDQNAKLTQEVTALQQQLAARSATTEPAK